MLLIKYYNSFNYLISIYINIWFRLKLILNFKKLDLFLSRLAIYLAIYILNKLR